MFSIAFILLLSSLSFTIAVGTLLFLFYRKNGLHKKSVAKGKLKYPSNLKSMEF